MKLPRIIKRYLSAWQAHRLAKRIKRNSYRLARMCPELARESARQQAAQKRHRRTKHIEARRVGVMNGLLKG